MEPASSASQPPRVIARPLEFSHFTRSLTLARRLGLVAGSLAAPVEKHALSRKTERLSVPPRPENAAASPHSGRALTNATRDYSARPGVSFFFFRTYGRVRGRDGPTVPAPRSAKIFPSAPGTWAVHSSLARLARRRDHRINTRLLCKTHTMTASSEDRARWRRLAATGAP